MGLGRIGLAVAKRFSGFEIGKIIYTATKPKPEILLGPEYLQFQYVDFEQLLAESDVIIVTAAYNDKTKEIFNREAFKKMKKTAFIINNARYVGVQVRNMKMDFNTGGTWRRVEQ